MLLLAGSVISLLAARRNSLTFDEPFMIAAGARAIVTGDMSMAWDQPPGMFYVYGAAVHAWSMWDRARGGPGVRYPSEEGTFHLDAELIRQLPPSVHARESAPRWGLYNRYDYAREFFARGNDVQAITFAARLVVAGFALGLGFLVAAVAWRLGGAVAAIGAAALYAFFPDVLAHGAVAYNDMPLAAAFFLAVVATGWFVERPSWRRGLAMGAAVGVALCIKFSALILGPIAIGIAIAEAVSRRLERTWLRQLLLNSLVGSAVALVILLVAYRGDLTFTVFREGLHEQLGHESGGHGVPTMLIGASSPSGFWYFYPVALFLKLTPAFHLLFVMSVAGWLTTRGRQAVWTSRVRPLLIAGAIYLAVLMQAQLSIGVRYALPLLPVLAVLTSLGLTLLWERRAVAIRPAIGVLLASNIALASSRYPWFLSYVTDYISPATRYRALSDSSYDWGQGLVALREFMIERGVDGVYLAYFGSVLPESYGIQYFALPSWRPLPAEKNDSTRRFEFIAISATHLNGLYEGNDPFESFRHRTPEAVVANSIFIYRVPASAR